jgi:hypothetical protein
LGMATSKQAGKEKNLTTAHSQALSTRTHRMSEVIIRITEVLMFVTDVAPEAVDLGGISI